MENPISVLEKIATVLSGQKSNEDIESATKSVEQLASAASILGEKAEGFKEKYDAIYQRLKMESNQLTTLQPDISVTTAKMEQAIAQKLTMVSSCCDSVLAGTDSTQLCAELSELEQLTKQRLVVCS